MAEISNVRKDRLLVVIFLIVCIIIAAKTFFTAAVVEVEPTVSWTTYKPPTSQSSSIEKQLKTFIAKLPPLQRAKNEAGEKELWKLHLPSPPSANEVTFSPDEEIYWEIQTDVGRLLLRLRHDWAPQHVINTMYLTMINFYAGITFHRVIPGFMAQFGCPKGDGTGGPGYKLPGEFSHPDAKHVTRGILSTANSGPNTDGSQVFIMFSSDPYPSLDGKHTVYGELVEGFDTLESIEGVPAPKGTRPPVKISSARIITKLASRDSELTR